MTNRRSVKNRVVRADLRGTAANVSVAGIVLAAGTGSRFSAGNKLCAEFKGKPVIRHVGDIVAESPVESVTVVLGYEPKRVRSAMARPGFEYVVNDEFRNGLSTSVSRGVEAVSGEGYDVAVFLLGDMPCIAPETLSRLITVFESNGWKALAASYEGKRGNPALFDRELFGRLASMDGDHGGREILTSHPEAALVETNDPGVLRDIDTVEDLEESA